MYLQINFTYPSYVSRSHIREPRWLWEPVHRSSKTNQS